jgi:ATP-dependent DNA ligase
MVLISEIILVTRNARDKIQIAIASLNQNGNSFLINRSTGQYQGKMTEQPTLLIEKGKAKRSVIQQAELEFNSIVNKYMDKGYKKLSSLTSHKFDDLSSTEMEVLVSTLKTDQSGNLKPMLAKSSDKCQNSVLQKPMLCSRKLNGVRCMMKWDAELNNVRSISRGGKNYDVAAAKLMKEVHDYLQSNPDLVLDGELYVHGMYLQTISGIARLETWEPRCDKLEYWIYDIASDKMTFEERNELLIELRTEEFVNNEKIKVLEHYFTESWDQIQQLHDKWVIEGFEGLVARKPDKTYEFGKRGSTMIKVKMYQDQEFEIIDYQDGLRDEDFCFICQTDDGKQFAAKPIGSRELKAEYIEDIDNIIGKKGVIKFFEWSKDGVPLQPVFQAVRYDLD